METVYDPNPYGMFNQALTVLGSVQKFLTDPHLVMFWIILPTLWMGLGPGSIIYLACLKQIPEELYEAADIDGAGFLQKATGPWPSRT